MIAERFDVVVAGGGPAALSAALVLGRARLRVLVVDASEPANAVAKGVGGLLGHDADTPASALRAAGAVQLQSLGGVELWRPAHVRGAWRSGDGYDVEVATHAPRAHPRGGAQGAGEALRGRGDGAVTNPSIIRTRALLLAGGLRHLPPALPGLEPLWGLSVFHCPFCDGWEVRGRRLAVHADGATAVRRGLMLRSWSDDVLVVGRLSVVDRAELTAAGVRTRESAVVGLEADPAERGRLHRIRFADGSSEACDALFVDTTLERHDDLAEQLGCAPRDEAPALVAADPDGRTSVPGVYAAGDVTEPVRSVAIAIGSGARVGKRIALDLLGAGTGTHADARIGARAGNPAVSLRAARGRG